MAGYKTIGEALRALRRGDVTSTDLVEHAIAAADSTEGDVAAFARRFIPESLAAAGHADRERSAGNCAPLLGVPVAVKDVINTEEAPTRAHSTFYAAPARDAEVVARLRRAGAVIMGKTATLEFAIGMPGHGRTYDLTKNPLDTSRWSGGSSSGSAAGLVTGAFLGALGTDTAGSIRVPAAFCGVTGLMPTRNTICRAGCLELAHSLDRIGPLAHTADDCALLLEVLAPTHGTPHRSRDLAGLRIGVDDLSHAFPDPDDAAPRAALANAVALLTDRGACARRLTLPYYSASVASVVVIMLSEALALHLHALRAHPYDYASGSRRVLTSGVLYSAADYARAKRVRRAAQAALSEAFRDVDVILTPTVSASATPLDDLDTDPHAALTSFGPVHTAYWNAMRNPVASIPSGRARDGLPLGLQVAGRPGDDHLVLQIGTSLQEAGLPP